MLRRIYGFYQYVGGNPLLRIDWLGLCTEEEVNKELKEIDRQYREWIKSKCKEIGSSLYETCKWWLGKKSQVCADLAIELADRIQMRCCYGKERFVYIDIEWWTMDITFFDTVVDIWCKIGKCRKIREEKRRTYKPYPDLMFCKKENNK